MQYSAAGYVAGAAYVPSFDVVDRLSEIRVPTLIVVGSHDFITPPSQARRTAAGIPGAEVVELAESGHYPFPSNRTNTWPRSGSGSRVMPC